MEIGLTENTAASDWHLERENWTSFYEQQLRHQLRQAIDYTRLTHHQPTDLKPRFESLLVLLRRTHARSDLHLLYIDLLMGLHPWPIRWGRWDVWEEELIHALPILKARGRSSDQAAFMTYLAEIQLQTGRLETALSTDRQAMNLAWKTHAFVPWSMAGSHAVLVLNRLGQNEEARRLLNRLEKKWAAASATVNALQRLEAVGHLLLRRMIFLRHDGRSLAAAQQAQTLIEQLQIFPQVDLTLLATLYTDQATMLWASDQYESAVTALQQAIAIYADLGDLYAETSARGNLGLVYWSMSKLTEAEAAIRQSLDLSETLNARWRMMSEIGNLCAVSFSQGKLLQALQYTERHFILAKEADDAAEINRALGNRALALLYLDQDALALPDLETSIEQLQALGLQQQLAETFVHFSYCLFRLGRAEEAQTAVTQAISMAAEVDSPTLDSLILRCRALLAPQNEAVILMEQALTEARRLQRRFDEASCLLRLAVWSSGQRRHELWAEGVAILHTIGAEAWLNGRSPDNPPTLAMLL